MKNEGTNKIVYQKGLSRAPRYFKKKKKERKKRKQRSYQLLKIADIYANPYFYSSDRKWIINGICFAW